MTKLAYIKNNQIEQEIDTNLTDEEAMDIDDMLHRAGVLEDNEELATVD
jgi:hypothetical protein